MYLEFYQLKELPFNVTPDPRFLFFASRHREAFDLVRYGIEYRKGFIMLCGEVGAGKTTLCRAVLASLPAQVQAALVLNPLLTETQLIRTILQDFGLPSASRDRLTLIDRLNGFLLARAREGLNVAVIIDEAQNLSPAVMEQVRLLSNLETDQHKLLQIVLAGQPELKARLALPELRQLRQRILVSCELQPLDEAEVAHYLAYRLQVAGAAATDLFEAPAIRLMHRHSGGIPRLINALADRTLMAGFVTAAPRLGKKEVVRAVEDLGGLL